MRLYHYCCSHSLELAAGARPMHWHVSEHPVPVAASSETDKAGPND